MVGTAQGRLCPPYGFDFQRAKNVIASPAKQFIARQERVDCFAALAMTPEYTSAISPRVFCARFAKKFLTLRSEAQGMPAFDAPAASSVNQEYFFNVI
jgi:hypothetical protein